MTFDLITSPYGLVWYKARKWKRNTCTIQELLRQRSLKIHVPTKCLLCFNTWRATNAHVIIFFYFFFPHFCSSSTLHLVYHPAPLDGGIALYSHTVMPITFLPLLSYFIEQRGEAEIVVVFFFLSMEKYNPFCTKKKKKLITAASLTTLQFKKLECFLLLHVSK